MKHTIIFVTSDGIGVTISLIVKKLLTQFDSSWLETKPSSELLIVNPNFYLFALSYRSSSE
jgi:regulator of PEP synthase PpsR (kinase-PPPase family)